MVLGSQKKRAELAHCTHVTIWPSLEKIGWVLGDYPTDLHQTWPPRLEDEENFQQHFIMVGAARCTGGH